MRAIYIAEIEIDEELTDCVSQSRHNALMALEMMLNTALCHTTKDGKPFVKKVGRAETVLVENIQRGYAVYFLETNSTTEPGVSQRGVGNLKTVLTRSPSTPKES